MTAAIRHYDSPVAVLKTSAVLTFDVLILIRCILRQGLSNADKWSGNSDHLVYMIRTFNRIASCSQWLIMIWSYKMKH